MDHKSNEALSERRGERRYSGGILTSELRVSWKHATKLCLIQAARDGNCHPSLPGLEAIANPGLGHDISCGAFVYLQLLSQMTDENPKVLRLLHAILSPNGGKQRAVGNNLSRMAREVYQ